MEPSRKTIKMKMISHRSIHMPLKTRKETNARKTKIKQKKIKTMLRKTKRLLQK
jgi:hypothetical protein